MTNQPSKLYSVLSSPHSSTFRELINVTASCTACVNCAVELEAARDIKLVIMSSAAKYVGIDDGVSLNAHPISLLTKYRSLLPSTLPNKVSIALAAFPTERTKFRFPDATCFTA